jgi:uncharacterized protein (DUF433 family)
VDDPSVGRPETVTVAIQFQLSWRPILDTVTTAQFDRITMDPEVLAGKPCIRGLRLSVGMIVHMIAAGKATQQILDEYPYLDAEDVRQALAYSAQLADSGYHLALRSSA